MKKRSVMRSKQSTPEQKKNQQDKRIGRLGERLTLLWLLFHGFSVLDRNWHSGRDEVDIVAKKGEILSFVEVKTRTCDNARDMVFGTPASFVDTRKQTALLRAARAYLSSHAKDCQGCYIRMDVMEVYRIRRRWFPFSKIRMNFIENAFGVQ